MEYLNPFRPVHRSWPQKIDQVRRWAVSCGLGVVVTVFSAMPAESAERIQFFAVGPFEVTLYVEDLEQFAETGEINDRFAVYANRLSSEQRESLRSLRSLLNWRFDVDPVMISQFTYSPVGERLLQRAGQIIQTDNFRNGFSALRAAVILAAADEAGCTGINILKQFPLETVQLDYFLTIQVLEANQDLFNRRAQVISEIQRFAQAAVTTEASPMEVEAIGKPGPQTWQKQTFSFQNPHREVSSVADLYLPDREAEDAAIPVVVISHGLASDRQTLAYLAEHLASYGYGVVMLEHAETSAARFTQFLRGQAGPPDPTELLNRPRDITAALDTLEQRSQTEPILRSLNLQEVGVLGQSLGGYTVLAAAGATINRPLLEETCSASLRERLSLNASMLIQCRITELPSNISLAVADDRVKAVLAMNPLTSHIFGEAGLQVLDSPVMLLTSSNDFLTPALLEQIQPFAWLKTENKILAVVENGTHFSSLDMDGAGVLPVPESLTGPDAAQSHAALSAMSRAFFDAHLTSRKSSMSRPSELTTTSFEVGSFRFSLVNQLPPSSLERLPASE